MQSGMGQQTYRIRNSDLVLYKYVNSLSAIFLLRVKKVMNWLKFWIKSKDGGGRAFLPAGVTLLPEVATALLSLIPERGGSDI